MRLSPSAATTAIVAITTLSLPPLSSSLLLSLLPFIIFAADRYCCLPLRYHRSLYLQPLLQSPRRPFIIFSLPPAAIRLPLMPPAPLSSTAVAAAVTAHYLCCRCRKYNRCYRHRRYYSNTIATDFLQRNRRRH